jgi:hypothetical protein
MSLSAVGLVMSFGRMSSIGSCLFDAVTLSLLSFGLLSRLLSLGSLVLLLLFGSLFALSLSGSLSSSCSLLSLPQRIFIQ